MRICGVFLLGLALLLFNAYHPIAGDNGEQRCVVHTQMANTVGRGGGNNEDVRGKLRKADIDVSKKMK